MYAYVMSPIRGLVLQELYLQAPGDARVARPCWPGGIRLFFHITNTQTCSLGTYIALWAAGQDGCRPTTGGIHSRWFTNILGFFPLFSG